jgi:hypothetical protein
MSDVPRCTCHGEEMIWSAERDRAEHPDRGRGRWRCAVKEREKGRRRYRRDPAKKIAAVQARRRLAAPRAGAAGSAPCVEPPAEAS